MAKYSARLHGAGRIGTCERECNGFGMALGAGNDGTGRRPTGRVRRSTGT
jgi:hypothetical protein